MSLIGYIFAFRLISPNLRWVVSCSAVANGGLAEWNFIYAKYNNSQLGSEKVEYLRAMGCSKSPSIILQ